MPIRQYKPTGPARRFRSVSTFEELTKKPGKKQPVDPHKPLLEPIKRTGGRNNKGRVTHRFHGGGHKRMYRIIDFKRNKYDVPAKVLTIEYDPNRSCRISLVEYEDGEKRYILTPIGPATACHCAPSRSVRRSITSNCILARADNWYAPPVWERSSWRKRASTRRCAFHPERPA